MKTRLLPLLLAALAALLGAAPRDAWARHGYGPPPGRIVVQNHSGGTVNVSLTGQAPRTLGPWQSADLYGAPGEAFLRATYVQFGAERLLQTERLYLSPGRTVGVNLGAETTARVLVTNLAPYPAQLSIDGRPGETFSPGEARVISTHTGRVDLAMLAQGRTFDRTTLDLRAFEEPRWAAQAPRIGDLVVENPLPIPVQLVCEKGLARTVAPYGRTTYVGVAAGPFHLTARRETGEFVDHVESEIRAGSSVRARVDAPRTGFVSLDSDHWLAAEVRIDGKRMTTLAPNAPARIEAAVGWHELRVTDTEGRVLLSTWIEVEPFELARVSFGLPHHERVYDGRSNRGYERHERGGTAAVAQGDSCAMR
jgi:hypothetical protein